LWLETRALFTTSVYIDMKPTPDEAMQWCKEHDAVIHHNPHHAPMYVVTVSVPSIGEAHGDEVAWAVWKLQRMERIARLDQLSVELRHATAMLTEEIIALIRETYTS
jgi:hypothetical protein